MKNRNDHSEENKRNNGKNCEYAPKSIHVKFHTFKFDIEKVVKNFSNGECDIDFLNADSIKNHTNSTQPLVIPEYI